MAAYEITGAFTSSLSPVVPYHDGATVWVLAFDAIGDADTDDPSTLRAFKSTDSGQTWATAGGGTKAVLTRLGSAPTTRVITREHPEWPSQPHLYALYANTDEQLHISRYNTSTESWDQESSGDLDLVETLPGGFAHGQLWSFDFTAGSPGDGGLLFNDADGYQHTNLNWYDRVSYVPITRASLAFGTPVRVDGQPSDDIVFSAGDVRRGVDNTLHGFLSQSDPADVEPSTAYQSVLRFVGAGPGAPTMSAVASNVEGYPFASQVEERGSDRYVYVLTTTDAQAIHVGQSTAAGITFAEVVDEAGYATNIWPFAVAPNADIYRAFPSPGEQLERQTYDGATLGSLDLVHDAGATIGTVGAGAFAGGSACVFSLASIYPVQAQQCWFAGVVALQLLGGEGIKSEEAFGQTHGLLGGGPPVTCGDPVIVPPVDGCSPTPVTPIPPGQEGQCDTLGFSY